MGRKAADPAKAGRAREPPGKAITVVAGVGVKWKGCWVEPMAWNSLIPFLVTIGVEFDSDPFANPHLNADPGTIIAFPGETFGLNRLCSRVG